MYVEQHMLVVTHSKNHLIELYDLPGTHNMVFGKRIFDKLMTAHSRVSMVARYSYSPMISHCTRAVVMVYL